MEYIDVFSGIGGIGLALAPFVKPILYCEWDRYCQQVLVERMRDGDLEKAPIHADIKTLHPSLHMKPKMIGGGFPCQDISTAGAQLGMAGDRSSLFFEIMRIVDEAPSIEHVFLENVANICKCGFQEVFSELQKRGFNMVWTTRSAASMGAPHQRSRWFCLASKNPAALGKEPANANANANANADCVSVARYKLQDTWAAEWPKRITIKNDTNDPTWDPNWIARSHTLGNTVVPCVVRAAYVELVGMMSRLPLIKEAMAPYAMPASKALADYPYPESGIMCAITCDNDQSNSSSSSSSSSSSIYIPLPVHKQSNQAPTHLDITVMLGAKEVKMNNYPTLRRGITHPSNVTERSLHDLPTVLCNTTVAHQQIRDAFVSEAVPERIQGIVIPNMNYLEWMMGYPADWTKVKCGHMKPLRPISAANAYANAINATFDNDETSLELNANSQNKRSRSYSPKQKRTPNCMHLFMKDTPGKDVRQVAIIWRDLPNVEKEVYRKRAADLATAAFASTA